MASTTAKKATATTVRSSTISKAPATPSSSSSSATASIKRSSTLTPSTGTSTAAIKKPTPTTTASTASTTTTPAKAPVKKAPVSTTSTTAPKTTNTTRAAPVKLTSTTTTTATTARKAATPIPKPSTPVPRAATTTPQPLPPSTPTSLIQTQDASTSTTNDSKDDQSASEEDVSDLKSQIAVLESSLESRDIEVLTLQNQLDELLAEQNSKQNSFASELNSESVFEKLENENQALQRQLAALRKEKDEQEELMKEELEKMTSRIRSETSELDSSHESELATLRQAIAAQTSQLQSVLLEISHLKESNHAKDFELARSARDYLALQNSIAKAAMVEDAKKDELEFARESVESGRARIHELELKVQEFEAVVAAASREFNEHEQEKIRLTAQIEVGNEAASKAQLLSASLESAKQAFEGEKIAAIQSATAALENEKAELLKQLDLLRVAHEQELQFSELLQQSRSSSAETEQQELGAAAEIQELKTQIKELEEVVFKIQEERKTDIATFTQEKSTLLNQIELGASQAHELAASIESLQQEIASEKSVSEALKLALDSEKAKSVETITALESQKANIQKQLHEATEIHLEALRTISDLKDQISTHSKSPSFDESSHIHALEGKLFRSEKDLQILQERLSLTESSLAQKAAQLSTKERDYSSVVLQSYNHLETIGKLQERVKTLEEDLSQSYVHLGGMATAHSQLMENHGNLTQTAVNADVASHTLASESLTAVTKQQAELESVKAALQAAVNKLAALQEAHAEMKERLQSSENHVDVLEQNVRNLKLLLGEEENKVERLKQQLASLMGDSSVELLMRRKNVVNGSQTDAEKIAAFEKLVSELEIQLVSADFRALKQVKIAGVRSPIMNGQQLRIVNEE
ncbi:UNVERIFIED_CONTAM: hypothetical protein HDU68_011327 [Siphonaria sp. JEL0065]|nr:hypothetical protein HDU68_011327 [Siphonaria sp. JEL0065]